MKRIFKNEQHFVYLYLAFEIGHEIFFHESGSKGVSVQNIV